MPYTCTARLLAAALFAVEALTASFAQSKDAEPASRAVNDAFLKTLPPALVNAELLKGISIDLAFDFLGVRLPRPKARPS